MDLEVEMVMTIMVMVVMLMLMVVMMNLEAKPHSSLLHLLLLDGVDLAVQPGQQGGDRVKGEGEREAIGAWVEQGGEEGGVKGEQDGGGGQPAALAPLLAPVSGRKNSHTRRFFPENLDYNSLYSEDSVLRKLFKK